MLPPLLGQDKIEARPIKWQCSSNSVFGSVKLCKKMASVLEAYDIGGLSGIVMADCCNMSRAIFDYMKRENHSLFVYIIHVPRKIDEDFSKLLIEEWVALESFLGRDNSDRFTQNGFEQTPYGYEVKSPSKHTSQSGLSLKNDWCVLPEATKLTGKNYYDNVEVLLEEVSCPRLFKENNRMESRACGGGSIAYTPGVDNCCVNQKYCVGIHKNSRLIEDKI